MPKKAVKKTIRKIKKSKSATAAPVKKVAGKSASKKTVSSKKSTAKKASPAKKTVIKKKVVRKKTSKKTATLFDKGNALNPHFPQPNSLPNWPGGWLTVIGARQHNLKSIDVSIPLGTFTVVTGVSGSGKSSFVEDVLYNTLAHQLHRASLTPGSHERIEGLELINKVIRVDQQPLGQTPTSNPATYTGAFELIRNLFAQLPDAKLRGYTARRFSFNVPGGRCEKCEGNGQLKIEMHFLPDVWITCDACNGKRYDRQTLEVKFRDRSIADVLELSCGQALELFRNVPKIRRILQTICDVGLDYLSLGQAAPTLSGGEAQKLSIARALYKDAAMVALDEPTAALDALAEAEIYGNFNDLVKNKTSVYVSHRLASTKFCDRILLLDENGIAELGTHDSLMAKKGEYYKMFTVQGKYYQETANE